MNNIFDIIENKKQDFNMSIQSAVPRTPEEADFILAKKYVDSLPIQYNTLLLDGSFFMKKFKLGKNHIINLEKYVKGTRIIIEIVGNENKAVQKVSYYSLRNSPPEAYAREILGGAV